MRLTLPKWVEHARLRRHFHRQTQAHVSARLPVIQRALDAARPGYVLLIGDSHAEMTGRQDFGNLPLVNAGIGGASARGCAGLLPRLRVPVRASTAVVFTGSNDIMARAAPLAPRTFRGFEAAVERLLTWAQTHAGQVLVLAVPPIEELPYLPRELAAVEAYSHSLERLARQRGAGFADPYAPLRDGGFGLVRPGALADGIHLADYGGLAARLAALLKEGPAPAAP